MALPLTGLPDTDRKILLELHDIDLFHACSSCSYFNQLCNDDFWRMKFIATFGANLKNYKDINYKRLYQKLSKMNKENVLLFAAGKGYLELVQAIVEQGANILEQNDLWSFRIVDEKVLRILRIAIENGHLTVVKYLLEQGAQDQKDLRSFRIVEQNDLRSFRIVEQNDLRSFRIVDDFALRLAAETGQLTIVKYLVEQGANIHARNDLALVWAAANGHLAIVKYLVEQGATIHARDQNDLRSFRIVDDYALRIAAENGHLAIVKYLVEQGANIHAQDNNTLKLAKLNALKLAKLNGHKEVVNYLQNY